MPVSASSPIQHGTTRHHARRCQVERGDGTCCDACEPHITRRNGARLAPFNPDEQRLQAAGRSRMAELQREAVRVPQRDDSLTGRCACGWWHTGPATDTLTRLREHRALHD